MQITKSSVYHNCATRDLLMIFADLSLPGKKRKKEVLRAGYTITVEGLRNGVRFTVLEDNKIQADFFSKRRSQPQGLGSAR